MLHCSRGTSYFASCISGSWTDFKRPIDLLRAAHMYQVEALVAKSAELVLDQEEAEGKLQGQTATKQGRRSKLMKQNSLWDALIKPPLTSDHEPQGVARSKKLPDPFGPISDGWGAVCCCPTAASQCLFFVRLHLSHVKLLHRYITTSLRLYNIALYRVLHNNANTNTALGGRRQGPPHTNS